MKIILLLLIPTLAFADSLTFKWTAPSKFEDGTTLTPATDIDHYNLKCGPTTNNYLTTISTGTTTSYTMSSPAYDPIYCISTAVTNTLGSLESSVSGETVGFSKGRIRGVNSGSSLTVDDGQQIIQVK